jgi:hypothetical protein
MNYNDLKEEIKAIADLANEVPETFRERCFELLLQHLLGSSKRDKPEGDSRLDDEELKKNERENTGTAKERADQSSAIPTPSQVKVFMQRAGITAADMEQVMIYEDNEVHFVQEPPPSKKIARGQIEWALLLALKNGITTNSLSVDPESVRSICQEKGFYDQANFSNNFKTPKNAALFQGPMEPQGQSQKLTPDGQKELGKLIKELALTTS